MKTLLILVFLIAGSLHEAVWAAGLYDEKKGSSYSHAEPDEIMRLPKYCWGHYNPRFKGPAYNIDRKICGPYVNHFCPGILRFNRSQNLMANAMERQHYLRLALKNFDYTTKGMQAYPGCYIRKHAIIMEQRAKMAAGMQGGR